MLGYVRCEEGELLVKHHRLYSAAYCGLCHTAKKEGLSSLLPVFRYDFVFLFLLRVLVTGEKITTEKNFCPFHPRRMKKQRIAPCKAASHSAWAAVLLAEEKMRDDLCDRDGSVFSRLLIRFALPHMAFQRRRFEKRNGLSAEETTFVSEALQKGRELEEKGAGLDDMCENFGSVLSFLFSFGTEGEEARLLGGLGERMGRFLYTLDALDDLKADLEKGSFNPLIRDGQGPTRSDLVRIDMAQSFLVDEMKKILDLAPSDPALYAICENVICRGLPAAAEKAMKSYLGE